MTISNNLFDILTTDELNDLKAIYSLYDGEDLLCNLKKFFNEPVIFYKISSLKFDPSWVAYEIFINGYRYGFNAKN